MSSVKNFQMPRFDTVRWVPLRFRSLLPLEVMEQYHCVVVGASNDVLTVAFTDEKNAYVIEGLRKLTGQNIFPVLINPVRMRLLLKRIASYQQNKRSSWRSCYVNQQLIRSMLTFYLTQQRRLETTEQ